MINQFVLGYANRTLGLRLPQKNRKAGAEIRSQLERLGIYRDTGREHFNGSLVIPVINEQGLVEEVYGRKLLDNLRKGTPKHTYLPGPHEGVFNVMGLKNTEEVILCESLIDALTFWRWGFKHVTASYGVNGFTEDLFKCFTDNKIKRLLIAYDRDEAGNTAAQALAEKLMAEGIDCYRVLFPKGMDANEYALTMTPAAKALDLVLRKAEWMGKAGLEEAIQTRDTLPLAEKPSSLATPIMEKTASPLPPVPPPLEAEVREHEVLITLGDRHYRIRGLSSDERYGQMKINLMVKREDVFHMDKLDLYSAKQRTVFMNQAGDELGVKVDIIKNDLGKILLKLEALQDEQKKGQDVEQQIQLTADEKQQALLLLNDPDLLSRILKDFSQAGVVGEDTNKLVGYLACVSRKLAKPLGLMIQSSSAAGKTSLMDAILNFMPQEQRVQYSAMTGQSLFYMGETNLQHKILALAEEEGVHNASYALKLLQSEGEVTIASTGKDESTGNLVTKEYKVQGPVMLFMTTTALEVDEELLNRCLVLTVNESREQTRAIHQAQRQHRTLAGLHAAVEKARVTQTHRNAQRLLRPLRIINPYADKLTFLDDKTRTRRDHEKYLTLIDSIVLLHQYQRPIKTVQHQGQSLEYIEATLEDIETANRLAHEVLGRSLDELPPQTRKLLTLINKLVTASCQTQQIDQTHYRFSRKIIRDYTGWSDSQLKTHCRRLEEMEYLLVHSGRRGQRVEYELLYSGSTHDGAPQLAGLLDVEALKQGYDANKSGVKANKSVPSLAPVCPKSGGSLALGNAGQPNDGGGYQEELFDYVENAYISQKHTPASHRNDTPVLAAKA